MLVFEWTEDLPEYFIDYLLETLYRIHTTWYEEFVFLTSSSGINSCFENSIEVQFEMEKRNINMNIKNYYHIKSLEFKDQG